MGSGDWERGYYILWLISIGQRNSALYSDISPRVCMYAGNNPKWNSFVMRKIKVWQQYFLGWAIKGLTRPVLVLRYEDLETDRIGQMKRMLDFLRVPYSEVGLQQRMTVDLGALHQQHRSDFEHFTPKQKEFVRRAISGTLEFLRRWNHGSTFTSGVAGYLKACMIKA